MDGGLVREARLRAGLTQAELADRVGTTQSAIARVERGGSAPSLARVRELVTACGLELRGRVADPVSHRAMKVGERLDAGLAVAGDLVPAPQRVEGPWVPARGVAP